LANTVRHRILCTLILFLTYAALIPTAQSQEVRYLPASEAVGYGGSAVAHVEDASAVYWNPAALALIRGSFTFLSVHDAFLANYLAYARFFPLYGSIGFALGRFAPSPDFWDIGTVALARPFSEDFALGLNFDLNRQPGEAFPTFGFSLLFSPTDKSIRQDSLEERTGDLAPRRPLRLALTVQRVPIGKRYVSTLVRAGLEYRPGARTPWLHTAFRFESGKTIHSFGFGFPLSSKVSLYSGMESFDLETFGLGVSAQMDYIQAQIVYSQVQRRVLFSLGFRISEPPERLAQRHYQAGIQRVREGRLRAGLADFRKYLEYRPREPRVLRFVALLEKRFAARRARVDSLLEEGSRLEAQEWYISAALLYKKALEYDPDAKRVRRRLNMLAPRVAKAIREMITSGQEKMEAGDLVAAKTQFERVLMYDPDHQVAKQGLEQVVTKIREQAEDHYVRGLGYFNQRNFTRARQEFTKALEIYPEHEDARQYLARTDRELTEVGSKVERLVEDARRLEEAGKVIEAFQKYREILKYEPEHAVASERLLVLRPKVMDIGRQRYAQAQRALRRGQLLRAFAAASTAVDLSPQWEEARALLRKINGAIRDRVAVLVREGETALRVKNWSEALRAFDAALRLSPKNARVRRLRREALERIDLADLQIQGQTAFDRGSYQEALNYFERILEKAPNDITARKYAELSRKRLAEQVEEYFSRGMVFFAAENYEAAIREWDRALSLDPNHSRSLEYRAKAEQRLQALKSLP
jgi:tetratricopeptide (TPR) repeat protein